MQLFISLSLCLYSGDLDTAKQLVSEQPSLQWASGLCEVHRGVLGVVQGEGKEQEQGLLEGVRQVVPEQEEGWVKELEASTTSHGMRPRDCCFR